MDEECYNKLNKLFEKEENKEFLVEEAVTRSSGSAGAIFLWVKGQKNVYIVNKVVKPKKAALEAATAESKELTDQLNIKLAELKQVEDKVAMLEKKLESAKNKKMNLEAEYKKSKLELERAKLLIENLSDEKERWKELGEKWKAAYNNLIGDVLISSGVMAYLGPFTAAFRKKIIAEWAPRSLGLGIPGSEKYS